MSFPPVNLTQDLDLSKYPFRQNILDYSHLRFANILDAIGAALFMWMLAACVVHLSSLVLGMSTRSLVVNSSLEKYLFPNIIHLFRLMRKSYSRAYNRRSHNISQAIAGFLVFFLLVVEGFVILSASQVQCNLNLEELNILLPKFSPYNGPPYYREAPKHSYSPLVAFAESISMKQLNFYFHRIENRLPVDHFQNSTIYILFGAENQSSYYDYFSYATNGIIVNFVVNVQLTSYTQTDVAVALKSGILISDCLEMATWTGNHIKKLFNCPKAETKNITWTKPVFGTLELKALVLFQCAKLVDDIGTKTIEGLFFSTVAPSVPASRQDFRYIKYNFLEDQMEVVENDGQIDWDKFAKFQASKVRGYVWWICSFVLLFINILLGAFAPDLQLAKVVAVEQCGQMMKVPSPSRAQVRQPNS